MLRVITGKAGSGKTAAINREIRQAVEQRLGGRLLIVPEQYSHEAERELCRTCGDTMSLYAEVLSFTGFARKVAADTGGIAVQFLDKGGKALCMAQALKQAGQKLAVFNNAASRPELQSVLLKALEGMKASCIGSGSLLSVADTCGDVLKRKLTDLAMISDAYDAVLENTGTDPSDRLSLLAAQIHECTFLTEKSVVYVDGFTDFTTAELAVLKAIMARGADLTVCLTTEGLRSRNEIFSLPGSSGGKLLEAAAELGIETKEETAEDNPEESLNPLRIFADQLFSFTERKYDSEGRITLLRCENMHAECEAAAARILELVREKGCRWRDIAVAVRGFEDYAAVLENVTEEYGIPLFSARRSAVAAKPLPMLLSAAYSVILNGWNPDDVLTYLGTGLTGLSMDECDILASYVDFWSPDESAWKNPAEWHQHPEGYGGEYTEETEALLAQINSLRRRLAAPLLHLQSRSSENRTAAGQAEALAAFLEELSLAGRLEERAAAYAESGERSEAEEYRQLWAVTVSALEQAYHILGHSQMGPEEFSKLFLITLSGYDIGIIPATLDAVTAGDFDRMRRRNIKHLIVLGADDSRLPAAQEENGIFSEDELRFLSRTEAAFGESPDKELWREYMLIYNTLSLPSETLSLLYSASDEEGNDSRPSMVIERAKALFGLQEHDAEPDEAALSAFRPAFRLAAAGNGEAGEAAAMYFEKTDRERLETVREAARRLRGSLSPAGAEALYGRKMHVSASRAEKFYSCRCAYFWEYGLKAKPYRKAEFSAAEMGTFTHYVLQHMAEDISASGGFSAADDETIIQTARRYCAAYEKEMLHDFREKNERFRYLFRRSEEDVVQIALDMAQELRSSAFTPLAFELNFSDEERFPQILINEKGDAFRISGIADRVDALQKDGKVYLRVIDYKTGKKEFSLSDVWYGRGMQLLLYLYALQADPEATAKAFNLQPDNEIRSAGAVYAPVRNPYLSLDGTEDEEEVRSKRSSELKRSGIILGEDRIPELWDTGEQQIFSPVKKDRKGNPRRDSVLTAEEFALLYRHMKQRMEEMANAVRTGSIEADPYTEGTEEKSACKWCDYAGRCGFADGENGEHFRTLKKMDPEDVWDKIAEEVEEHG